MFNTSCKKIIDEIIKHPNGAAGDCRIQSVTSTLCLFNIKDTARFSYNAAGNTVSIAHSTYDWFVENMDSSPNHYFQYYPDGKLALHLESANPYTNQPGEDGYYALNWHKYSYEGSNLIIDSTFIYASGPVNGDFRPNSHYAEGSSIKVTWLHLDSNGRIIKSEHYADQPNSSIEIHHYDNNGNLVLPGATYNTSKYKFRQTHKTWMLISRNYSVHSSSTEASTYNNKNLPAKMKIMPSYFFVEAPDETYSNITFHYECR